MDTQWIAGLVALGYRPQAKGADLESPNGREIYEFKVQGRGVRDLRDSVVRLATSLTQHPKFQRGYLLTSLSRISASRVRAEWSLIRQVLRPEVVAKMHLVAIVDGTEIAEPSAAPATPVIERFLQFARANSQPHSQQAALGPLHRMEPPSHLMGVSWKHLEVEKVLLHRWMLHEGLIATGALSRQVGCSYPTAIQAIRQLSESDLIQRGRGRSVGLAHYPRDRWTELYRSQRLLYPPVEFIDPTGDPATVEAVLGRLDRIRPKGVAMGGVAAARKWDPSFDLNGTPRIDLLLHIPKEHAPQGKAWARDPVELVRRLDPALQRRTPQLRGAAMLVVHRTYRQDSLFLDDPESSLPWADPVEVLWHLNHLGLTAQAGQLLAHLRDGKKHE